MSDQAVENPLYRLYHVVSADWMWIDSQSFPSSPPLCLSSTFIFCFLSSICLLLSVALSFSHSFPSVSLFPHSRILPSISISPCQYCTSSLPPSLFLFPHSFPTISQFLYFLLPSLPPSLPPLPQSTSLSLLLSSYPPVPPQPQLCVVSCRVVSCSVFCRAVGQRRRSSC